MKTNEILASVILEENLDVESAVSSLLERDIDGICVYDYSENDKAHEENIHKLKHICEKVAVPVYAGGRVEGLEDVKKYLYAGASGVIMANSQLINESIARFKGVTKKHHSQKTLSDIKWEDLKKNSDGLVPCIVQDYKDGTVLMMAYMNEESFHQTLETETMTYFSRSRNKLWVKGEESGHFQKLFTLTADCDFDTLLAKVDQTGVACHTGERSCFFNNIVGINEYGTNGSSVLDEVYEIILNRKYQPKEGSYTNYLFDKGIDKILKKVGEEASEIIIAAKNPSDEEIIYEIADLLYHLSVLMALKNVTWKDIMEELKNR